MDADPRMHPCPQGGGMHGRGRGHVWQKGCAWQEKRQLHWEVRILLECILVKIYCYGMENTTVNAVYV